MASVREINRKLQQSYLDSNSGTDYDARARSVRDIQAANPNAFARIQDTNTDNTNAILNAQAFDAERWANDPVRRKGMKDIEFNTYVPFGFAEHSLPGPALGSVNRKTKRATFPGSLTKLGNEQLARTIAHEGQHRTGSGENAVRRYDDMYLDANNVDKELYTQRVPEEYKRSFGPSGSDPNAFRRELLSVKQFNRNDDLPYKKIPAFLGDNPLANQELNQLSAQDKLQLLNNMQGYEGSLSPLGINKVVPSPSLYQQAIDATSKGMEYVLGNPNARLVE